MGARSVVLLSGGLDSTINLYEARLKSTVVCALTFDYGQRAAAREREMARRHCDALSIRHEIIELPFFSRFTRTSLVDREATVPTGHDVSIDDMTASERSAKAVWVPNRNGILLNVAAGFAEGLGADWIVPGFNIEEAATFPDNTDEFLRATSAALAYSTANHIEARCFTTSLDKTVIAKRGRELGVRFEFVWPCYFSGDTLCGQCESCQRYARAMRAAGLTVPSGSEPKTGSDTK